MDSVACTNTSVIVRFTSFNLILKGKFAGAYVSATICLGSISAVFRVRSLIRSWYLMLATTQLLSIF